MMSQEEFLRRKSQSEQDKQALFENRLHCKKEVAKILGISIKTIDVLMARKEIEWIKIGSAVRFNPTYLNAKFGN